MEERPVYSTDPAFCPACRRTPCCCVPLSLDSIKAGTSRVRDADPKAIKKRQPEPLRLSFQRGAKGSGVTRIERLIMHPTLKLELLARFKKRFGCGGAVKDGALELQGDHRDVIEAELKAEGYQVRRVGG